MEPDEGRELTGENNPPELIGSGYSDVPDPITKTCGVCRFWDVTKRYRGTSPCLALGNGDVWTTSTLHDCDLFEPIPTKSIRPNDRPSNTRKKPGSGNKPAEQQAEGDVL